MSEEKILLKEIKNSSRKNLYNRLNLKKELNIVKEIIFSNIIEIINQKEKFILGPEKSKVARFISQNYIDIYILLDNLLRNNIKEDFE